MEKQKYQFDKYTVEVNENGDRKIASGNFNMVFRKSDGFTAKWGRTKDENPTHCPWGNEIADIEITTSCSGIRGLNSDGTFGERTPCAFCYKSNTPNGTYMSFDTFKTIFDKMNVPKTMTQIAFGVDAECKTNPDAWKIMDYCIENNVTPNVTVADIDEDTARNIVSHCGACAVSAYEQNKNCCYDSVKLLVDEAKKQGKKRFKVNIHLLVSHETEQFVFEVLHDRLTDERLKGMGAIVLLSLKKKGRGKAFSKMDDEVYQKAINFLQKNHIAYGSDSCGANRLADCLKDYYKSENHIKRIAEQYCRNGKYYVAVLGDRQMLDFSKASGKKDVELWYIDYLQQLSKVNRFYDSEYVSCLYGDSFYAGSNEIAFLNNYGNAKHFLSVCIDNNGEHMYRYCKQDILELKEVPYEYLEPHFRTIAEKDSEQELKRVLGSIEECESLMYSVYINVNGELFPCSFMEGEQGWEHGIDMKDDKYKNFTTQVWNHPRVLEWRNNAIQCIHCNGCNQCLHYEI